VESKGFYTSFALSYRKWHHRMTPKGFEHKDACTGLTAFETLNVFSLLITVPFGTIPRWLFLSILFGSAAILYWHNRRTYRTHPATLVYAKFSDNVPGVREFPLVYGYLFLSLLFFFAGLYVAVRSTA
jgi:hypothetical protein